MFRLLKFYTVQTNALNKACCCVDLENPLFPNIFIFKACHLYRDTGNNIYS